MSDYQNFTCNVSYSAPANSDNTPSAQRLTVAELWQGIKRGARNPNDFGDFVRHVKILEEHGSCLTREMSIGDGAVHLKDGDSIVQEVTVVPPLYVQSITRGTGAKTIMMAGHSADEGDVGDGSHNPYLTLIYELKMGEHGPAPDSVEALTIEKHYKELAVNMVRGSIAKIRAWKMDGKLEQWRRQDLELEASRL
ncbi:unnamed protein product [Zymoseptoria tritici ST99CH_1A5]|uniref:Uncharacterized protein n=3 Tax=Zymoseptoria tritici TaxID=1047171 RepID=A0A1X7RI81_ZYMT9|nr:unnamed protein product [Zymoseptoria tritici ST99CH_3D7]SMR45646.1 unnamed protein product [Zymoseptoria tritici ST99CH_1E4]SMR46909.1 unnamed protein product [Zymoseptoria tritici ST99CH_3D1]SMY20803.1 unnamed protein product [Zymoseptoria tritici ST99CH_1A5]